MGGPSDYSDYSGTIAGYPPSTGGEGGDKIGTKVGLAFLVHFTSPLYS